MYCNAHISHELNVQTPHHFLVLHGLKHMQQKQLSRCITVNSCYARITLSDKSIVFEL